MEFTALLHHGDVEVLRRSFFKLKKTAAVGIDGVTWKDYERDLKANLSDLHVRIHRGSYRAKPLRRSYIDKPDGRKRKLGITSLEDKIAQHAVSEILQCIREADFLGFSYGFRRGRSQHDALDALSAAISDKKVNRHWLRSIRRRSQKARASTWERMIRLGGKYLPRVRVIHPYPSERFHAQLETGAV